MLPIICQYNIESIDSVGDCILFGNCISFGVSEDCDNCVLFSISPFSAESQTDGSKGVRTGLHSAIPKQVKICFAK